MRPRKLKLVVNLGGMKFPIATLTIKKFAEVLKSKIDRVCGNCGRKPKWHGYYECDCCPYCGKPMQALVVDEKGTINYKCQEHGWQQPPRYKHWSQLKEMLPNGTPLVKEKLTTGETVEAELSKIDIIQFSQKSDATLSEYGVTVTDINSAQNLRKLLIASRNLGYVIIARFNDTYEQRVVVITTNISNRIMLKELIPDNLLDQRETMKIDFSQISNQDIQEAQTFVKQLPDADESTFIVKDYRTEGITIPKETPKVLQLETILAKQR